MPFGSLQIFSRLTIINPAFTVALAFNIEHGSELENPLLLTKKQGQCSRKLRIKCLEVFLWYTWGVLRLWGVEGDVVLRKEKWNEWNVGAMWKWWREKLSAEEMFILLNGGQDEFRVVWYWFLSFSCHFAVTKPDSSTKVWRECVLGGIWKISTKTTKSVRSVKQQYPPRVISFSNALW